MEKQFKDMETITCECGNDTLKIWAIEKRYNEQLFTLYCPKCGNCTKEIVTINVIEVSIFERPRVFTIDESKNNYSYMNDSFL